MPVLAMNLMPELSRLLGMGLLILPLSSQSGLLHSVLLVTPASLMVAVIQSRVHQVPLLLL